MGSANLGKQVALLRAEDTPENLTRRLQGTSALHVEAGGAAPAVATVLAAVPGVTSVRPARGAAGFEVEAEGGRDVRADVARAVIGGGFDLLALTPVAMSREEIFLQLTTSDAPAEAASTPPPAAAPAAEVQA